MIDCYTIKFGLAVSQKGLEKMLSEAEQPKDSKRAHLMKAEIDIVAGFADLKRIASYLKEAKSLE